MQNNKKTKHASLCRTDKKEVRTETQLVHLYTQAHSMHFGMASLPHRQQRGVVYQQPQKTALLSPSISTTGNSWGFSVETAGAAWGVDA
mmetsp:Transcript_24373/g.37005  ORF Transcript_24373/g.37005 Transcript_24373/m.37005 type:complete len:89 (-) Transcript_24373:7-273(-)